MSDRLNDTLSTLRTDVDRAPLADSSAVRARGNQRTRRQAVGTSLAVVALVAGAVGISGALTGTNNSAPPPAVDPTVTTSVVEPPLLELAADPFARGDDLTGIGPYGAFQDSGQEPVDQQLLCIDVGALSGAAEQKSTVLFEPDIGEATVHSHALRFPSANAASQFVAELSAAFSTCDPGDPAEATVEDRGPEPVGDTAVRASRLTTPTADAGIGYYELGVVSDSNIVVVMEWSSMGNPIGEDAGDWVWNADRLDTVLDRAIS